MQTEQAPTSKDDSVKHWDVYVREPYYCMGMARRETFPSEQQARKFMEKQNVKCHIVAVKHDEYTGARAS